MPLCRLLGVRVKEIADARQFMAEKLSTGLLSFRQLVALWLQVRPECTVGAIKARFSYDYPVLTWFHLDIADINVSDRR